MKSLHTSLSIIAGFIFLSLSCDKKDTPTPKSTSNYEGKVKLQEGYVTGSGAKFELWAPQSYFVGYNTLFVKLTDSTDGSLIDDGHIHFYPEMDMGTMKHGAPTGATTDMAVNDLFQGSVLFTMPSGDMGSWKLGLKVHNHKNGKTGRVDFGVSVTTPGLARLKMLTAADDSSKLYLALVEPTKPKVGVNDFKIAVFEKKTMYEYPAVNNLTVEIEPTMPSMGHGSPNNVNPTYTSDGIYAGKVNYTMTGDWNVTITLKRNGTVIGTTSFDFLF